MTESDDKPVLSEVPAPQAAPEQPKRRGRYFELGVDSKGAMVQGGLYSLYTIVCLMVAVKAEPNSIVFYAAYFLTFLWVFQGGTIVLRQCLHVTPKSAVALEIIGKTLHVTRKNGSTVELTRDIDYTRKKNALILQGNTHDNQKFGEVIREGTLADGLDPLVSALKKFR